MTIVSVALLFEPRCCEIVVVGETSPYLIDFLHLQNIANIAAEPVFLDWQGGNSFNVTFADDSQYTFFIEHLLRAPS